MARASPRTLKPWRKPFAMLAAPAHASTGEAVNPWVALAYLVSGVFFILALRGLSSPATSQRGNRFGMIGMLTAVVTTLVTHEIASLPSIAGLRVKDCFSIKLADLLSNNLLTVCIGPITGKILDQYNINYIYPDTYTVRDMMELLFKTWRNSHGR